ncbi:MAG: mannitol dehydrogenase family protein [Actinomycetota bacterium]
MRPERIVHLGLGAFFKAHQAWYTEKAKDHEEWGIVAYTGRSPKAAEELKASNFRYTLITRHADRDEFETISSVVRAVPATDVSDLIATVAKSEIAVVTLTITEAGYQPDDSQELSEFALGRLSLALAERNRVGSPPLAVVSCDNMPDNGNVLKAVMQKIGKRLGPEYLSYLEKISFVSTSIDRITPKITPADIALAEDFRGAEDPAAVVTEPFADWVLQGEFPLGRPDWESAGAKIVEEIAAFENRKLWLLNGAHTLISCLGQVRGLKTVDQAMRDQVVNQAVEIWWRDACSALPKAGLNLDAYLVALRERFLNPRIGYQLTQIAQESLTKLQVRTAPVAEIFEAKGRISRGSLIAIASYLTLVIGGVRPIDSKDALVAKALSQPSPKLALLELVSPALASSKSFQEALKIELLGLRGELRSA